MPVALQIELERAIILHTSLVISAFSKVATAANLSAGMSIGVVVHLPVFWEDRSIPLDVLKVPTGYIHLTSCPFALPIPCPPTYFLITQLTLQHPYDKRAERGQKFPGVERASSCEEEVRGSGVWANDPFLVRSDGIPKIGL